MTSKEITKNRSSNCDGLPARNITSEVKPIRKIEKTPQIIEITETTDLSNIPSTSRAVYVSKITKESKTNEVSKKTKMPLNTTKRSKLVEHEEKPTKISKCVDNVMEKSSKDETSAVLIPMVKKSIPEIVIPSKLESRLKNDWLIINRKQGLLQFPKVYTIERLISSYKTYKATSGLPENKERDNCTIILLLDYFNNLIHSKLMYPGENKKKIRNQAISILKSKVRDGNITNIFYEDYMQIKKLWHFAYSPTYLLRIFIILPEILMRFQSAEDVKYIVQGFHDFLGFMENNFDTYFNSKDYKKNYTS